MEAEGLSYRAVPNFKPDAQRGAIVGEAALIMGGHAPAATDFQEDRDEAYMQRRKSFSAMMRKRTPPKVLPEDLNAVREYVMCEVRTAKQDIFSKMSHFVNVLQTDLDDLRAKTTQQFAEVSEAQKAGSTEARRFTVECSTRLTQDLNAVRYALEHKMCRGFEVTEMQLREMQANENAAKQRLEWIVDVVQAKLAATMAVRYTTTNALMKQQRSELDAIVEDMRREMSEMNATADETARKNLEDFAVRQKERDATQDAVQIANFNDLQALVGKTEAAFQDYAATEGAKRQGLEKLVDEQVCFIRGDADKRIKAVEEEAKRLYTAVSEVENIPTRRVEWVIKDISSKLRTATDASWLSPLFEAAGAHNLQLELRILPPADVTASSGSYEDDSAQARGDCAVLLWAADEGFTLVCKLCIGSTSVQLQHTFDGSGPAFTKRMSCMLKDMINPDDDSLRVAIEILEAVREVQNLPRPPTSLAGGPQGEFMQGPMISHRYLNHRTLDLVQDQVDRMKSRMVRRIEWRLEQGSVLRKYFPEGECVCSTTFEAAGIGGLQLVFYPSGYAGAKDGYCSFFLHCPGGSFLRCWLSAGKQRREAKLTFEHAGFFGRTNFCRYENCVEPSDDTVLLLLEIEEAEQSATESMWHQPMQQPGRTSPQESRRLAGTGETGGSGTPPPLETSQTLKINSDLKLRRTPGKAALEDVKQLPSIWTSRPQGDISEALEGFHTFSDIKASTAKKLGSARGGTRPGTSGSVVAPPPVAPRYMMYAA
eukprot:TRINITY_DN35706_c0_g1_i1.p1 TRINITY_DN35706_c0_g1~~TRINITY_DN35706_c0_g1_i1.p1  ORF type:complete len:766 (-),score=190.42 TRINITY_DN35706_c0_g1_i1:89-2386(-)